MAKTGRNDSCPCGSGKKYKRCCLEKDEAAASTTREAVRAAAASGPSMQGIGTAFLDDAEELTEASNAVVDLVHAGKLDEAEQAAHDLQKRFPDMHDGYDRLGMVYGARGDNKRAADCYRKVIALVDEHPEGYDPEFLDTFRDLIERLDPPAPPAAT
jgi:tetratricopeptide (TPR) repeat protein